MKKLALILALMIIPCSAFGLEMLNDSSMDSITGQSGVSIAVDDVQLFLNIEKLAWIDCDGINSSAGTCAGAAGAIALNNFQIDVLNVNAIVDGTVATGGWNLTSTGCGQIDLFYDYANTNTASCYLGTVGNAQTLGMNNYFAIGEGYVASAHNVTNAGDFQARALTIDATDKLPALTAGFIANNPVDHAGLTIGGVLIGIPTLEIYIQAMTLTPVYDGDISNNPSTAANDDTVVQLNGQNANFGTIEMQGITFTTLSGWLEIAPH